MEKSKPLVSVIIPTKNEEKNIERCLLSLAKQTYKSLEIIVVDNESRDETVAVAKKYASKVLQKGPERSAQRNFGAKDAMGELLFFVDADMEVEQNVVREAVALSGKDSRIKAIIVPEVSVGENYWARVRALERSCYLGEPTIEAARMFDKKSFLRVGGFDEDLIAAEDWDLHQRVKNIGKIGRTNARIAHHEGRLSLLIQLKKRYYYEKNIQFYRKKHPKMFKAQRGIARVGILVKNWKKLASDPVHGIGVFIFKFLEYVVFWLAKLTWRQMI